MPRRNSKRVRDRTTGPVRPGPAGSSLGERTEPGPDGHPWVVRAVPGSRAVKAYRCPGCDHEVVPGVAHVVAWPDDELGGAEDRRHWHSGCWAGRQTRGLTRRWS